MRPTNLKEITMTPRDFCFWLQGYFEIGGLPKNGLTIQQTSMVGKHLDLVFAYAPSNAEANANPVSMTFCETLKSWFDGQKAFSDHEFLMDAGMTRRTAEALSRVFKHEIDPSMGPADVQDKLDSIHNIPPKHPLDGYDAGVVFRC